MKCKKHGEIGDQTIKFELSHVPLVNGVKLPVTIDESAEFCLYCLAKFLKKKIGTVKK